MQPELSERVRKAPKTELHVHIEGTLEPELVFALAQANGTPLPYPDVAALRAAYDFADLQSFLDLYYACTDVLRTRGDFAALMLAYLARSSADGVVYAEIFFDPQVHLSRGIAMATLLDGLHDGMRDGHARYGIESQLILCFLRHLSEADGFATLDAARPHLDRIAGFGLDSSERGHPPEKFLRLFAACRALGKPVVAHAGEEGPAQYVRDALDLLQVSRIDHGVRSVESAALLARLAADQIPLTVCPLSNQKLQVTPDLRDHPLPQLLAADVCVTLNSDDPAYFGGYLNDNLAAVQAAFGWDEVVWEKIIGNGFRASFQPEAWKAAWLARLCAHFSDTPPPPSHAATGAPLR